ncbi:hypothetical protein [Undibacterium sp.]|jgi:hypothetical protein|uniref:hypothetical protein n=1 Tax=Undibacterium sp. TaxID=1914977 RepID=UPI002B62DDDF|nr:hypothetical protein [Undibacterium sp.]HTD03626.1 hypothetical protein [Undibacterium sp.]
MHTNPTKDALGEAVKPPVEVTDHHHERQADLPGQESSVASRKKDKSHQDSGLSRRSMYED